MKKPRKKERYGSREQINVSYIWSLCRRNVYFLTYFSNYEGFCGPLQYLIKEQTCNKWNRAKICSIEFLKYKIMMNCVHN
ncbi:hypothetical protein BpHYR1_053927 [Brachionus plicatilis]|uniref:Uncharacterized protein n=1 Tax=Brachionus plicatilis TaxID=10195 RepID=A0A3M7QC15_BRAPC|nr:hypothetical protein BpHYR1_053927 [Brachionus plicatilis]